VGREVEEFLSSYPYAEATKDTYRRVLSQLTEYPIAEWGATDLLNFVSRPTWGSSHRHTYLCACRKFITWKFGSTHPALSARMKLTPTAPQPRLSREQVLTLLGSFDDDVAGRRDKAIVAVALDCNLRATELCNLQLGNVHLQERLLYALTKGGQWQWKTFSLVTTEYISQWIEVREPGMGVQTLFLSFQSQNFGGRLTREGLQGIMRRWGERVGFHISPHMFRRSYASLCTLNGAPKNVVKKGGGWKSDKSVDRYIGDLELEATRQYLPMGNL
jgi:site-specific recombinase XerC